MGGKTHLQLNVAIEEKQTNENHFVVTFPANTEIELRPVCKQTLIFSPILPQFSAKSQR